MQSVSSLHTADIIKNGRLVDDDTVKQRKRNKKRKEYHDEFCVGRRRTSREKKINSKESSEERETSRSRIINDSIIKLPFFRELSFLHPLSSPSSCVRRIVQRRYLVVLSASIPMTKFCSLSVTCNLQSSHQYEF